ncbi:hypothetical protein B0H14DRAFT_3149714 [Mycena olivaceomarginata]|nr:hypothetical protein B0H14DRAFT_3149714 [Mycena olivaceomarginata]
MIRPLADNSELDTVLRLEIASWNEAEIPEDGQPTLQKPHKKHYKALKKVVPEKKPKATVESKSSAPAQKRKLGTDEVPRKKSHFYQPKLDSHAGAILQTPTPKTSKDFLLVSASLALPYPPLAPQVIKQELVSKHGNNASGARKLNQQICSRIHEENRQIKCLQEAESNGWPLYIDFDALITRFQTLKLGERIFALVMTPTELQMCPIWQSFLDQISYKVHAFGRAEFGTFCSDANTASRCGHFGPRGKAIIVSVVKQCLKDHINPGHLHATIAALRTDLWDASNVDSKTIPPYYFIHYILAPFVATLLISDDLTITFDSALRTLVDSSDYGDLFHDIFSLPLVNTTNSGNSPAPASPSVCSSLFLLNHLSLIAQQAPKSKKIKAPPSTAGSDIPLPELKTTTLSSFPPPTVAKTKASEAARKSSL